MRIASLDIGTNTALCLIVEFQQGRLSILHDGHAIARLGEGVDKSGEISEVAYERFRSIALEHWKVISKFEVDHVVAVATSAMRDARNRETIIYRTKADTGLDIELLAGAEEAKWTYRGALLGLGCDPHKPTVVVDIGGGSTEISIGDDQVFREGSSIDVGAVRITERHFSTLPITSASIQSARELIKSLLQSKFPTPFRSDSIVAVAGTPTTLAAMDQQLPSFQPGKVQGYKLTRQRIEQLLDLMLSMDAGTLLNRFPSINQARVDILPAGTIILLEIMDYLGAGSVTVSTRGLRYGIALRTIERLTSERPGDIRME